MRASFTKYLFFSAIFWIGVSVVGSIATSLGMDWYRSLVLPGITPPGSLFGVVWTVIFTLTAASMSIALASRTSKDVRKRMFVAYAVNAALNILWSVLFFCLHLVGASFVGAILLALSVVAVAFIVKPVSRFAAIMLVPYVAWVAFAAYLVFAVGKLNGF